MNKLPNLIKDIEWKPANNGGSDYIGRGVKARLGPKRIVLKARPTEALMWSGPVRSSRDSEP